MDIWILFDEPIFKIQSHHFQIVRSLKMSKDNFLVEVFTFEQNEFIFEYSKQEFGSLHQLLNWYRFCLILVDVINGCTAYNTLHLKIDT